MNGVGDFIQVIDWEFNFISQLWSQIIMQNIFLSVMVVISLVALVITIRENIKQ